MGLNNKASKSMLDQLPVEVLQAVMGSLDEAIDLPNLVLSCSKLYYAFKGAELIIVQQVIANELGPEVLPEAMARLECAPIQHYRKSMVEKISLVHFKQRKQPPPTVSLFQALRLSQFHFYVKNFTSSYVARTLALWCHPYTKTPPHGQTPVTSTEISRIQRVFYRFEIFRLLFQGKQSIGFAHDDDSWNFLSRNFSPWENNQLACVHDYLFSVVAPAFNDFVNHDVVLGSNQLPLMEDPQSVYFQHILRRGLAGLYEIHRAKTYDERHRVLYTEHPQSSQRFLYTSLRAANPWNTPHGPILTKEETLALITPPFYDDSDTGPEYAWCQGHSIDSHYPLSWIYPLDQNVRAFRKWGYVMWDRKRLDSVDFFNNSHRLLAQMNEDDGLTLAAVRKLHWTWRRRALIHLAGGRGWWSSRDESKIVWEVSGKGSPLDDEEKRRKCEYCIGEVRCAPHRLVLITPSDDDGGKAWQRNSDAIRASPSYEAVDRFF